MIEPETPFLLVVSSETVEYGDMSLVAIGL